MKKQAPTPPATVAVVQAKDVERFLVAAERSAAARERQAAAIDKLVTGWNTMTVDMMNLFKSAMLRMQKVS